MRGSKESGSEGMREEGGREVVRRMEKKEREVVRSIERKKMTQRKEGER